MTIKLNLKGIALIAGICMAVVIFQADWAKPLHKVAEAAVVRLGTLIRLHSPQPALGVKATENNEVSLLVTEVVPGFSGQKSDIEVGDTILEINGAKIASAQAYADALEQSGALSRIKVLSARTGATHDLEVALNKT